MSKENLKELVSALISIFGIVVLSGIGAVALFMILTNDSVEEPMTDAIFYHMVITGDRAVVTMASEEMGLEECISNMQEMNSFRDNDNQAVIDIVTCQIKE